ncbi:hypothetical protein EI94DRAFT_1756352 [Lactarius quietus]|nr:hypothetical protein EI94DRAFT_1763063 [Lactarius quietus]KAF8257923.1 hypothetical protein EI94DRAFT_1756352 [Lactarius quietus]
MKFSLLFLTVLFPTIQVVNAQSTNGNINVIVSPDGGQTYNPSNFTATNGTNVTFTWAQNASHSVTQSTFENPCTYLAGGNGSSGGFDSGIQAGGQDWTITITNDQEPIFYFCKSGTRCGLGMVGSINAPATGPNSADAFLSAAQALGTNQEQVSDNGPVTGGVNAFATAAPTPTSTSSSASPSSSKSDAGRLVSSGVFALLAAALSIMMA